METKEKKKEGLSRLFEIAGQKKGLLFLAGLLSAGSAVCMLVPYWAVYEVLKELLTHGTSPASVDEAGMIRWGWIAFCGLIGGLVLLYAALMSSHVAAFRILYGLRVRLSEHIGKLSLGYLNNTSTGAIKKTMEQNIEKIEGFIAHTIPDLVNVVATVVVMLVIFFSLDTWLTAVCLAVVLLSFALQFSNFMGKKAREFMSIYYDAQEKMSASAVQYVRGMPVVKIFGQSVRSFRQFNAEIQAYKTFALKCCDTYQNGMIAFTVLLGSMVTFILPVGIQLHGLAIKEMFTRFNEYMGASLLGNKGQLFVLETTERTRALFPLEKRGRDDIYTADRNLRQNRYRCRQCGKVYAVGKEAEYQTIRELKKQGCNVCGATVFDRLHKNGNTDKKQYLPLGHHILADFYNCDPEKLDDVEQIRTFMHEAAVSAGATIVQENFHKYAPVGVSGVVVIQESHLTIHTWPECGYAAVDLFTCGTNVRPWTAFDYLQERLGCAKVEYSDLIRGAYERLSLLRYSETEQPAVRRKKRQRYDASSKWNRRARSLTDCSVLSK